PPPTWTLNVQEALTPAASVPVHVTGVVPIGKSLPEGGTHTTVTGGEHASLACTCHVTSWPVAEEMSAGQMMLGGAVSVTVTVKVHELPLPRLSVALQVT